MSKPNKKQQTNTNIDKPEKTKKQAFDLNKFNDRNPTKGEIFDLFYVIHSVSRSGGGEPKKKMTRAAVSLNVISAVEKKIKDRKLLDYYIKLRDRKAGIAPPPRPSK